MSSRVMGRVAKLGITNFWRNRWLSLAATLVMTLTLLIIGIFAVLNIVINKTTDSIRDKMDISVYFNDSASIDDIVSMQQQVAARGDVKEVKYISKEDALANFQSQEQGKQVANIISANENPLPRSLEIKANQAESLNAIDQFVSQAQFKPLVHSISYQDNKLIIDRLIGFTTFLKRLGWVFSAIFVLISILVISNTIKLTIFTRKDEIEIMRYVGANDSFIKVPFVIEGLLYGLVATILATVFIRLGAAALTPMMTKFLGFDLSSKMMSFFSASFWSIIGLELLVGVVIGIGCSLISIRRYVKA